MSLPKSMRLKGHRTFNYIHKNSINYYGKLMNIKIAISEPKILLSHNHTINPNNLKIAVAISKKFSKKAVERNKLRRKLYEYFLKNIGKKNYHKPYWLLVNLRSGNPNNDRGELLQEFQYLITKSGLLND